MKPYHVFNECVHQYPVVVSFPHSGTFVPEEIQQKMRPDVILTNTDWFLPELYDFFEEMGVTGVVSDINRYVVDLNRSLEGNTGGDYHDLVYGYTTQGKPIYRQPLDAEDISRRIKRYYLPYYQKLTEMLQEKALVFQRVLLLDMHSFFMNFTEEDDGDIILSNLDHRSSSGAVFGCLKKELEAVGYRVTDNAIKGGNITRTFGNVSDSSVETIQVEIRYTQYLDDRYFGEEIVSQWNPEIFSKARERLRTAFSAFLSCLADM